MRRLPWIILAVALAVVATAGAAPTLYVSGSSVGKLAQFDAFGPPTALTPETVNAQGAGPVALTPDGAHLYAGRVAGGSNSFIHQFAIGLDGTLSPMTPATVPVAGENVSGDVAVTPDGKSLYYAVSSGAIYQFTIGTDGALTPKTPASVTLSNADALAVSPDGTSLYAGTDGGSTIAQYTIASDGTLAPKTPATVAAGSAFHPALAVAPGGDVYETGGSTVRQFSASNDGKLTPKVPATVPGAAGALDIDVSPDGASVYVTVADTPSGSILLYDRGIGGVLVAKGTPSVATTKSPIALDIARDGTRLYVAESGNYLPGLQAIVERYEIGAGGLLTLADASNVFTSAAGAPSDVALTAAIPTVTVAPSATPGAPTPSPTPSPSASPSPTPSAAPAARLGPLPKKAKVKRNRVGLEVVCLTGGEGCTGTLKLAVKVSKKRKAAGKASFTIAAGTSLTVKVKLSKAARKVRKRARKHRFKVTAVATAGSSTVKATVKLF